MNEVPLGSAVAADNRVIHGMDIDDYHRNDGSVSRSGLMLIDRSPQHFYYKYMSGLAPKTETDALRIGGAFHTLTLEPQTFNDRAVVVPEDAPKKPSITQLNAAKPSQATVDAINWWQWFEMNRMGRTVLDHDEFIIMQDMARAIRNQPVSEKVIAAHGKIESSFFWYDPDHRVHLKARPDYYREDGIVVDLKTTKDASRDEFQRSIIKYGYDVQAFMQMEGIHRVTGRRPESFIFVCVEKEPPYATAFYVADRDLLACGEHRYHKLLRKYSECVHSGVWPGYGSTIQPISVPSWELTKLQKEAEENV